MKRDTKEELLKSAKSEILKHGYRKASVRRICENAGVTTGALYFLFKDKEDIFASLVDDPLTRFEEIIRNHFEKIDVSYLIEELISLFFRYEDEFRLLFLKAEGSAFEDIRDRIVDLLETHNRNLAKRITGEEPDQFAIHWISHEQLSAFMNLTEHCGSEEEALEKGKDLERYLKAGWEALIIE